MYMHDDTDDDTDGIQLLDDDDDKHTFFRLDDRGNRSSSHGGS